MAAASSHGDNQRTEDIVISGDGREWALPTFNVDGNRVVPLLAVYAGPLRCAVDNSADWRTQVIANPQRTAEGLGESIASAIVAWPEGELHPRVKSGAQYVLTLKQTQVALLTCGGSKLKDSLRIAWTTSFVRAVDSAAMHSLSSKAWVQAFAQEPGRHSGTQPRRTWKSFIDDLCTHLHSEGNAEQLQRMMGRMQGNAKPSSGIGSMSYLELATK